VLFFTLLHLEGYGFDFLGLKLNGLLSLGELMREFRNLLLRGDLVLGLCQPQLLVLVHLVVVLTLILLKLFT
jgi:hypothetical protein